MIVPASTATASRELRPPFSSKCGGSSSGETALKKKRAKFLQLPARYRTCILRLGLCALWLLAGHRPANAEENVDQELLPLWEFGLFNAATRMPHYRGSSEYDTYVIPFPYFIYRGDLLQVNRGGMRAVFLKTEHWDSDLSFSGNPPVRDDEARQGMPDLPALGEVGPAIRWLILPRGGARTLYLQASARASFSADWNGGPVMDYEGLHGDLRLSHSSTLAGRNPWRYGCSLGLDVADSSYNGYFYDVAEAYAQPGRPAYDSRAGYAGASLSAYVVKQFSESFSFATFAQWENVSGSVFEDSPLVREKNNLLVACALTWRLATSAQSVAAADPREE